jgi:hypothetical protein
MIGGRLIRKVWMAAAQLPTDEQLVFIEYHREGFFLPLSE